MKSVKIPQYLYTASLFFLIFLTAVCVAISATDVIIQALTDKTKDGKFDFRNLIVVGGSYVLLATGALLFSCSRMLTVRASLQDIPKLYIPIKIEDLPKKVFLKIRDEFDEAKRTRKLAEPRPEDIQAVGWAKPGTPLFEGLDFKQAIARTPAIVEKVAKSINPDYFRPFYVPVRQYMEFLMQQGLIDKTLGSFYLEGYEIARFSKDPLSQEQYMDIMKHLAAILQNMGYNLKSAGNSHQTAGSSESIITNMSPTTPPVNTRRKSSSFAAASNSRRRLSSHKSIRSQSFIENDNISMTQSIRSRHAGSNRSPSSSAVPVPTTAPVPVASASDSTQMQTPDQHEVVVDDDYSAYDEDEVRNEIYELLMKDRAAAASSSQQHQI